MKNYILPFILSISLFQYTEADTIQVRKGSGSVYSVSYEEGLKEIHNLSLNSRIEDEYLFTDKWHDVGIDESECSIKNDDEKIKDSLKDKKFRTAPMIHIHPYKNNVISPPSFADLCSYVEDEEMFSKFNCIPQNLVADKSGVWTAVLSEKTKSILSKDYKNPEYISMLTEYDDITDSLDKFMNKNKKDDAIKFAIELYKKLGVTLTYREM